MSVYKVMLQKLCSIYIIILPVCEFWFQDTQWGEIAIKVRK